MKVFRDAGPDALLTMLGNFVVYRELRCLPRLVLLDAPLQNGFGGSGQLADWSLALAYRGIDSVPPRARRRLNAGKRGRGDPGNRRPRG